MLANIQSRFTGKERDTETGLDFFEARYYGSSMGRLLSPDPGNAGSSEDDPQSWNGYSYGLNNPQLYTDPDGREPCKNGINPDNGNICKDVNWPKDKPKGNPPPKDDHANAGFLGPFDIFFIRVPNLGITGKIASLLGRTGEKVVVNTAEKIVIDGTEAALKAEVEGILSKAASTVGNQSIKASSRDVAEQAAKEWVGQGATPIVERSTGAQVGWKSADGVRTARFTSASKASPHINLVNKGAGVGGNLHVRF